MCESAGPPDELIDSHLARFPLIITDEEKKCVRSVFTKHNHNLRNINNRETTDIEFESMINLNENSIVRASNSKAAVGKHLIDTRRSFQQL